MDEYVLRDSPAGAPGGLRRLRARAFRVQAYAQLIAREIERRCGVTLLSVEGGRFTLAGPGAEDAERKLAAYQAELDQWSLAELNGELVCYVVAAHCESPSWPEEALSHKMLWRREHALQGALVSGARWNTAAFSTGWNDADAIQCPSCGATATNSGDGYCMTCAEDDELGKVIASNMPITLPGRTSLLGSAEGIEWPAGSRQMPHGDFRDLAKRSPGKRKLLGYLSTSPEHAAAAAGFSDVFVLQTSRDLLLIGAWDQILRLALELKTSAGIVLASPQASLRASAARARQERARAGEDRSSLFGEVLDWKTASEVAERGFEMALWLKEDRISGSALRTIGELHRMSRTGEDGGESKARQRLDVAGESKARQRLDVAGESKASGWQLRYLPLLIWEARNGDRVLGRRILRLAADRAQWATTGLVTELAFLAAAAKSPAGAEEGKGSIHG
jgi:hypothetical protein